jgi:hypothetical protein
MNISHFYLCKKTAERFISEHDVVLYEYTSVMSDEHPDVLCYNGANTILFEIKVNYQDFKKDNKKDCRKKYKLRYNLYHIGKEYKGKTYTENYILKEPELKEYIIQYPHLGRKRYYVCPKDLIHPGEIKNGWGLYWYNGKFKKMKESKIFRNNLHRENNLLSHAFRKYYNDKNDVKNILIRSY